MAATIDKDLVNELRQRTRAGIIDCKKALVETDGDIEKAIDVLKQKGIVSAAKKASREASEGLVESYIHLGGRVGVLIEINCETDFVAKNDEFKTLTRDIAMHIAAVSPIYVSREEVPAELVEKEKALATSQAEGKPAAAIEKIVEGKLNKYFEQICLLEQPFVKDDSKKIKDVITEAISKMGENIIIRRFARYALGE